MCFRMRNALNDVTLADSSTIRLWLPYPFRDQQNAASYEDPIRFLMGIYCLHPGHNGPAHHTAVFFSPTWLLTRRSWLHIHNKFRAQLVYPYLILLIPAPRSPFMSDKKLLLLFYRLNQPASCLIHSEPAESNTNSGEVPQSRVRYPVPELLVTISKIVIEKKRSGYSSQVSFCFPLYIYNNKNGRDRYQITQISQKKIEQKLNRQKLVGSQTQTVK